MAISNKCITAEDLISRKRDARTAKRRHQVMYDLYEQGGFTYVQIGKMLGGRTPATVFNGVMKIANKKGVL